VSSPTRSGDAGAAVPLQPGLERKIGPFQAIAINMTQMCGIGPFVTMPLMVAALGGAQAMFGWIIGAIVVLADGLIWAELGAAMPGAGGTYIYLREAFQYRTGKLMPFLFVWSAVLFIPLIMSSGIIGLVNYLGYVVPGMANADGTNTGLGKIVGIVITAAIMLALLRKIGQISKLTTVLFGVMMFAMLATIVAAFTHFSAHQAFAFTPGTFSFNGGSFWLGLGAGLSIAVYDYLGYNTIAYLGAEVRNPGRTMPRAIIFSILGIMGLYFLFQVGVLGALPVDKITGASSLASIVLEQSWGVPVAKVITVLIVIAAIGSVFAGLLGGSRVPFEAARDKVFLSAFGKLHPKLHLPTAGVLTMGVITMVGSLFSINDVISSAVAVLVLIQSLAQVAAIVVLRRRQPTLKRPYKQWMFPLPTLIAAAGFVYLYVKPGKPIYLWLSLGWTAFGIGAFLIYAKTEKVWPFGPKEIREQYLIAETTEEAEEGVQA
jgi:amino acid transporter